MKRHVTTLLLALLGAVGCRWDGGTASSDAPSTGLPRIALSTRPRATRAYEELPTPLVYGGGFLNKTWCFETLVRMDGCGRITPGLAESWSSENDGRVWTFVLRPNAQFHSGARCDAIAVRNHMQRWIGGTEDAFIAASSRIVAVKAPDARTVRFELSEPHFLPADLALINPMSIVGPQASRDEAVPTLDGTGRFRIVESMPMRRFVFARHEAFDGSPGLCDGFEFELFVATTSRDATALWALERGRVDAVVEDWNPSIPREKALELAESPEFELDIARGSAVVFLQFNSGRAPFSERDARRRLAGAVQRPSLIDAAEAGLADPVTGVFAPWIADWPQALVPTDVPPTPERRERAVLMVSDSDASAMRLSVELREQALAAGFELELAIVHAAEHNRRLWDGDFDLCISRTWGVPYDPQATLFARLGPDPGHRTAVETPTIHRAPELIELVLAYQRALEPGARADAARALQSFVEDDVTILPLYAPKRLTVRRADVRGIVQVSHGYEIDASELHSDRSR